jgi:hypothetical protein
MGRKTAATVSVDANCQAADDKTCHSTDAPLLDSFHIVARRRIIINVYAGLIRMPLRYALVLVLVSAARLGAQSVKPIEQRQTPALREIGAFYFDTLNESQVWVNVEPKLVERGPDPIIFNVTVRFAGLRLDREPATVEFRPQVRCFPAVFMERTRVPVFRLSIDAGPQIDLSPDGKTSLFLSSCGAPPKMPVTLDTVSRQVPFAMLRRVADAASVTMDAIGFTVRLTPEDSTALKTLVQTVENGVSLRKQ